MKLKELCGRVEEGICAEFELVGEDGSPAKIYYAFDREKKTVRITPYQFSPEIFRGSNEIFAAYQKEVRKNQDLYAELDELRDKIDRFIKEMYARGKSILECTNDPT